GGVRLWDERIEMIGVFCSVETDDSMPSVATMLGRERISAVPFLWSAWSVKSKSPYFFSASPTNPNDMPAPWNGRLPGSCDWRNDGGLSVTCSPRKNVLGPLSRSRDEEKPNSKLLSYVTSMIFAST